MENETELGTELDGEAHGDEATEAHTEVAHEESGGLPQLDPASYPNQIFWLVVCLVAIYVLLSRIALPRIGGVLEQRSGTIQRDLDRAADMRVKAEEAEEQYHQALKDARNKAQDIAEKTKADVQADLDKAIAKADVEITKHSEASAKRIAKLQVDAEKSIADVAGDVAGSLLDILSPAAKDAKLIKSTVGKVLKG